MSRALLLLGCLLILVSAISACEVDTEEPLRPQHMESEGQTLYIEYCADCHQPDGTGWSTIYPNLAGNPMVTIYDPEPIITIVLNGQGSMPSFSQTLSGKQIAAILSYIRNAWGNHAPAVSPRIVK